MKSNSVSNTNTSLINGTDKVIFKVESDHLTTTTNFKPNNNFTNQLNNSIINSNNNNNIDIKQFKINQNFNGNYNINNNINHNNNHHQHTNTTSPPINLGNHGKESIKLEAVEQPVVAASDSTTHPSNTEADTKKQEPDISIYVNNVVCSYSTRCHLNLRRIAMEGMHVEYKKENGMVNMKLRKPYTTSTIWSSGKITCAGARSEPDAYIAARRFRRILQKMQFKVRMTNYRVVNVLATCNMPFAIDIQKLAENHQKDCSYEPELHPGATFKMNKLKVTLKLFTTGSITLTAPSVQVAREAINQLYPTLLEYKRNFEPTLDSSQVIKAEPVAAIKTEPSTSVTINKSNSINNLELTNELKQQIQPITQMANFTNFNYFNNNPQANGKPITKATPNITSISTVNNLNSTFNKIPAHQNNQNISIQKPTTIVASSVSSPVYTFNPSSQHVYHQMNPSSSYQPTTHLPNNLFSTIGSATSIVNNNSAQLHQQHTAPQNSFNNLNNLNPLTNVLASPSIISSNSFSTNFGGGSLSQSSNGWYYDSLVDNVDDFLP